MRDSKGSEIHEGDRVTTHVPDMPSWEGEVVFTYGRRDVQDVGVRIDKYPSQVMTFHPSFVVVTGIPIR